MPPRSFWLNVADFAPHDWVVRKAYYSHYLVLQNSAKNSGRRSIWHLRGLSYLSSPRGGGRCWKSHVTRPLPSSTLDNFEVTQVLFLRRRTPGLWTGSNLFKGREHYLSNRSLSSEQMLTQLTKMLVVWKTWLTSKKKNIVISHTDERNSKLILEL